MDNNFQDYLLWAKLVSVHPQKENINFTTKPDQPNEHHVDGEWKIYQDSLGVTRIMCLSASCIKVEDTWLGMNQQKELIGGERVTFSEDRNRSEALFEYIFCLVSSAESAKKLKISREESLESTSISSLSQENQRLVRIEEDLAQELICSLCIEVIDKCATLNPCQHNFCSLCLWDYLKKTTKCPLCQTETVSVAKNLGMENILQLTLKNFPHLQKPQGIKTQGLVGSIVRSESGFYVGSYVEGKKEGQGRFEWRTGSLYEGDWKNDKREGKGVLLKRNGNKYEGQWKDDDLHGIGKYVWKNGAEYAGNWVQGRKQGPGTLKYRNGDIYQGEWKNDRREGKGVLLKQNGDKYEGYWKDDLFNGVGRYMWKSGEEYEGNWLNGHRNGKGTLKYPDGKFYSGSWKGKKHGDGILVFENGATLEGNWIHGSLQNSVKIEYSHGDQYEGEINPMSFERHGKGVLTFRNGSQDDGYWAKGRFLGADREMSKVLLKKISKKSKDCCQKAARKNKSSKIQLKKI